MRRKIGSIILAVVMGVTMLAGCGNGGKDEGKTEADKTEADKEETQKDSSQGDAAGKKLTALFFTLEGEYFTILDDLLRAEMEGRGYAYESQSSNMDPVTMIEQIENATAGGTDALWIWSNNAKAISDACTAAKEQGVLVYAFVQDPGEGSRDVFRGSDQPESGRAIARLAVAWADEAYGKDAEAGSIKTVLMGDPNSEESKARFDALKEDIAKDKRFEVLEAVGINTNTVEAQTTAENMCSKYGEIDAFITCGGEMATGVISYITSEASPVSDPTKVGVFGTEINEELAKYIQEGILKGSVVNGGLIEENIAAQGVELDKLLKGEKIDAFSPVEMGEVTKDNLAQYGY